MSFTPTARGGDSPFEQIRQSLLQNDALPFADALTAEQIQQVFDAEGITFGSSDDAEDSEAESSAQPCVVYTPAVTLWAMISQALHTGLQRSCLAAVQRVAIYFALLDRTVSSTNTGAYCRARAKVPEGVVQRLAEGVALRCEEAAPAEWKWHGLRTMTIDGTTHSMPDTTENQAEYPQPSSQTKGLGFPMMRAVAVTSLATGMVVAHATGPYAGKETGETALFRRLFPHLRRGDLIVADRYYTGWFMLALLRTLGIHFVTRLHQHRKADFRRGKRLGKDDHLIIWAKPAKPSWLDQETYNQLPEYLEIRELNVRVTTPGFRTRSLVVVTSLLDPETYSHQEIATLYRRRWHIEIELRDIKTTMDLNILRRKTPEAVRQELWTGLLTYNLVRQSILQSAMASQTQPYQLSFAASLQMLTNTWVIASMPRSVTVDAYERLIVLRILNGHTHRVSNRPNRVEPRAVKRRPKPLALLNELRSAAHARLRAAPKL